MMTKIQLILFSHRDPKYAEFTAKLIPTLPKESFIGVRSPEYKKLRKELPGAEEIQTFLHTLPHTYYEENILHNILLCEEKDFDACLAAVERFLPYIDNWAVCDGLVPPAFGKNPDTVRERIPVWLASSAPYTVRFGMRMIMRFFLDERFDLSLLERCAELRSDEYYVNMMTAWLFAEALVKQWDAALPYIENRRLDEWTHNKAIQKAVESYRVTDEQKAYLKSLRSK